jgi:hypothetical protein
MAPMEKPWKVIAAFVGVFIAGSVFGGFFALRIGRQVIAQQRVAAVNPVPFTPPPGPQLLRRFAERLELSNEQRDKLRPVVDRAEDEIGRIRQTSLERTEAILRRMQQEFRAELNPEQIRALDRLQRIQNENLRREREERQRGQNFGPDGQSGMPLRPSRNRQFSQNRPFFPNRPFNPRNEGPRGPQDQPGPYGPPSRHFEGPPPGPRPEFHRGEPGQPRGEPPGPPQDRKLEAENPAEIEPGPGP